MSLKTGFEKEIGVTESQKLSEFCELNKGLPEGAFLYLELFDFQM